MKIFDNIKRLAALIGLGSAALILNTTAYAVPCSDTTSGVFLGTGAAAYSACADGAGSNDPFPSALTEFGMTFTALQKQNTDSPGDTTLETEVDINLGVSPLNNQPNGTWSFTNVAAFDTYVIVLKDGVTTSGVQWSAYLLDSSLFGGNGTTWSGDWIFGENKGLSHLSVYGKLGGAVPEPGILGLLGIGLLGVVLPLRRRMRLS